MAMELHPLHETIGANVTGPNLSQKIDEDMFQDILAVSYTHLTLPTKA